MCEAEWDTRRVSPESHLPSLGPAAGAEVGRPTRAAAGRSPRAGGSGRLSQARRARDGGPSRPRRDTPTSRVASLTPQGPRSSPRAPTASPFPESLPLRLTHPASSRDVSPVSQPQRPAQPSPSGLHSVMGADPSFLGCGRPCWFPRAGLPRRRGRRETLLPRMRRSLPGPSAPGVLGSPTGGVASEGCPPPTCVRRFPGHRILLLPVPLTLVHLQYLAWGLVFVE